jgi:hypothetical protein
MASNGGCLRASAACQAVHNRSTGFLAWHWGRVYTARGCTATHNGEAGFKALHSGSLVAGRGCQAEENGGGDDWVQEPGGSLIRQDRGYVNRGGPL